jgi:myo-inositol-1-phosphate synthase
VRNGGAGRGEHGPPDSAGGVIDAVRCCKLALDHGLSGALERPSAYLMKSPPEQHTDNDARRLTEEFIASHAHGPHRHAATQDQGAATSQE